MANASEAGFNQMSVRVHYDPRQEPSVTFSGDVNDLHQIEVPQGLALIVLTLVNAAGAQGRFASHPIQWVDLERAPTTPPPSYLVHRTGNHNVTIQVLNTWLTQQELPFFVLVQDGRQFVSNDPSIINLPPTGPPGGRVPRRGGRARQDRRAERRTRGSGTSGA